MTISDSQLQQIMPNLAEAKRVLYLPFLNRVMETYEINTPLRGAAFLAQLAHESGQFRFMEEIWGPTDQQKRYEPPSTLAKQLGNTQPGDGKLFKGRGPIQITGRDNYRRYGEMLGIDLISNPELAATPQIAFSTAGLYWKNNGLNQLADVGDFRTITKRINGGFNGLADRQRYYEVAKQVLGVVETRGIASRSIALPVGGEAPTALMSRGQETIKEDAAARRKRAAKRAAAKPAKKAPVKATKASKVTKAAQTTKKASKKAAAPRPSPKAAKLAKKAGSAKKTKPSKP